MGIVGNSGRAIRAVAPNSPREIVKAKVAATISARPINDRSIYRNTWIGEAPITVAACLILGRMLRKAGVRLRTTKGKATRVWAIGIKSGEARKSKGGLSSAMINPNPSVTADVPNGSIRIGSKKRLIVAFALRANAHDAGSPRINARITVIEAYPSEIAIAVVGRI